MNTNQRRKHDPSFKARVAFAALEEGASLAQVGQRFHVHPTLIRTWRRKLLESAATLFTPEGDRDPDTKHDELLKKIGELTVERDFLARGLKRLK